jgi:hypothetical protein
MKRALALLLLSPLAFAAPHHCQTEPVILAAIESRDPTLPVPTNVPLERWLFAVQ